MMTNISIVENKITLARKYLDILKEYKKYSRTELENDLNIRGAVERYLYLATQATIDTCDAFIALKDFRKPMSIREGFEILGEKKIISPTLQEKMVKIAGFRNIMAHDYAKIDYGRVYDIVQNKLGDVSEFIMEIKKVL